MRPSEEEKIAGSVRITRRRALTYAGIGAVAAAVGCGRSPSDTSESVHRMAHAEWRELVGEEFGVHGRSYAEDPVSTAATLTLVEATERPFENDDDRPTELRAAAVSLLFVAPAAMPQSSGTYTLESSRLGRFKLFLHEVPRDDRPDQAVYEAVLN